ncbi:hypothetical protein [Lyngbya sp. CCY1209]|uniref:ribbon-helix-helix domain-containing protein n=1 Tax=Lyngbya sp. CCY1209 TaxID=2886103 RepID=UPI002D1FC423|nr:hypothetical protein [Lyngbya sp. CCY1209]MEB3886143.1 hypothetical protein [Lyngbya sp. CCY1209]
MTGSTPPRGKKVHVTLPLGVYEELVRRANFENRSVANLAGFLLEYAIATKTPPPLGTQKYENPDQEGNRLAIAFIRALAKGEKTNEGTLTQLARDLGIGEEVLIEIRDRVLGERGD